jgi:hypothetical protein
VGVVLQLPAPGMQHAQEAWTVGADVLGIGVSTPVEFSTESSK